MAGGAPIRKRMKRRELLGDVRFVTFSCHRRLPLLRHAAISRLFLEALSHARVRFGFELFAYVVMPEHVHILLRPTAAAPLERILLGIKHPVARRVIGRWRDLDARILQQVQTTSGPRFWQKGGGFDRNVRTTAEFTRTVFYIHQNPVTRGLVRSAADWEFSSVRSWLTRHRGQPCGIEPVCDPPPGREDWASWTGFMEWPEGRGSTECPRG